MAICLAESLIEHRFCDARDLLQRFLRWHRQGENSCGGRAAGISSTTRATLEAFEASGRLDVALAAQNGGNGCIMRLAPVAICHRHDAAAARRCAEDQARVTHTLPAAVAAAGVLAAALVEGLRSGDAEALLRAAQEAAAPALPAIAAGRFRATPRAEISSAPRAVDTLEAALWCVARAASFEAALLEAVNLGGDTDTIGAVTGQLAGAVFGAAAIPRRWRAALHSVDRLTDLARRLHDAAP
jgi:ADP-ribosyl-[dinitrogen reductase] hydrolase